MVSRDDVFAAYRLLLGREPESDAVVEHHAQANTMAELRNAFICSPEFQLQMLRSGVAYNPLGRHRASPAMQVEVESSSADLQAMFAHVASSWDTLGRTDPYWSVLAFERFDGADAFYATGTRDLAMIAAFFSRAGRDLREIRSGLDYGCGLGRVTLAMADVLPVVHGLDVSESHIAIARGRLEKSGIRNVRLSRLEGIRDLKALPRTEFAFSSLVLQHNPPPLMLFILRHLLRSVSTGGFALFQLPTYRQGYRFSWSQHQRSERALMEMHVLPASCVFQELRRYNFDVLEIQEDAEVRDPDYISQTVFARRRRAWP